MVNYTCKRCKISFDDKSKYDRHITKKKKCTIKKLGKKTNKKDHYCKTCDTNYSRKSALMRHMKTNMHINNIKKKGIIKKGSHNNQIIAEMNGGVNTINNNSNNTTIHNYFISAFGNEEISKLTTQDKIAILSSDDNPMITIIVKTNLNSTIPEYHNIGYADLKSGYGYIYNGETWEKKEIRLIMNDLINFKGRDIKKIHKEVSKYMTTEDNKNIDDVIQDINNTIEPKNERHMKNTKNMIANLKAYFYNKRNLIIDAIEKSGKTIIGIETKTKQKNILKNGMTIDELDKILAENRQKAENIAPQKELAKYILSKYLKISHIDKNKYAKIIEIIDDIIEEQEIKTITRLLCAMCYDKTKINVEITDKDLFKEQEIINFMEKYF